MQQSAAPKDCKTQLLSTPPICFGGKAIRSPSRRRSRLMPNYSRLCTLRVPFQIVMTTRKDDLVWLLKENHIQYWCDTGRNHGGKRSLQTMIDWRSLPNMYHSNRLKRRPMIGYFFVEIAKKWFSLKRITKCGTPSKVMASWDFLQAYLRQYIKAIIPSIE